MQESIAELHQQMEETYVLGRIYPFEEERTREEGREKLI